jgi:hypothetical protein
VDVPEEHVDVEEGKEPGIGLTTAALTMLRALKFAKSLTEARGAPFTPIRTSFTSMSRAT